MPIVVPNLLMIVNPKAMGASDRERPSKWRCPYCMWVNAPEAVVCEDCEAERPRGKDDGQHKPIR